MLCHVLDSPQGKAHCICRHTSPKLVSQSKNSIRQASRLEPTVAATSFAIPGTTTTAKLGSTAALHLWVRFANCAEFGKYIDAFFDKRGPSSSWTVEDLGDKGVNSVNVGFKVAGTATAIVNGIESSSTANTTDSVANIIEATREQVRGLL